ncbi:MucBP domain-containing protein [Candidatus Enterococcus ferrettii]|uniref:Gram-positive cocci surface proteins LPxTG domain-containing protein n=1 Tax=Candidatus Enterococcus ferrettii TaxID=2815324 RepID=A0ABV0ESS4_9ENTE|nr:MucBP domain-containing protein [Enterococcus sp. 665A]MBO1341650.1 MucBP domain-containing protein [Enterococcus sp. 665A]
MKKSYNLLCIAIIFLGQLFLPVSVFAETATNNSEAIDTWMPDKNLQKAVAEKYDVDVDHLTKELLENNKESYVDLMLTDDLSAANESGRYYVENLEGLQYISGMLYADISLYHTTNTSMSINQSYFLTIKNDSKRNHTIFNENYNPDFTNFALFWDYLNDDNAYSSFSLSDNTLMNRMSDLRLETSIDDYRKIVLPISDFYQKGTPFSDSYSGARLSIDPSEAVWDNDFDTTEEEENPLTFLDYVYVSQEDTKLVYAIYLEDDNLVFKLKKGDLNQSDIDLDKPLSTSLSFYHMLIPTRSLLGNYRFSTQLNADIYLKNPVNVGENVTVQYQDTDGNTIAPDVIKSGNVGDSYTTEQLTIDGYSFKEIKGAASGTITTEPQTVTYVYTKNPVKGAEVTVQYQDTDGNTVAPDVIKTGNVGDAYTTEQLTIDGYSFKEVKGAASGTIATEPQTVTYVYTKDPIKGSAEVTVQYQDIDGTTIAPNKIKTGNVGDTYTTEQLTIDGYSFKEVKGAASGTFTTEPQTVTYVYTKNPVIGSAEVTVQYQDTNGNTIAPNMIKTGNVGDTYTTEQLTIDGYSFKEVKGAASGTFTTEPQTVTYVYTKNPVTGSAEVTVQYQDTDGNTIAPNVIKTGNVGDSYTTEQLTIDGYSFKEVKGAVSGTFTTDPQTVTYIYTDNQVPPVNPSGSNLVKTTGNTVPVNSKSTMKLLPQTGESKTILFTLLGGVILIIGVYIFISKQRKLR